MKGSITFHDVLDFGCNATVYLSGLSGIQGTYATRKCKKGSSFLIRWGFISEFLTRGWKNRLARPSLEEVEAKWGARLPRVLEEFYRSGIAEQFEFYLVPPDAGRAQRWFIGCFIPLTVRDISEWIKGTMLPGIPIALDGDSGFYYLPFEALRGNHSCPVLHRDLAENPPYTDAEVASSVEDFVKFQVVEPCDADEEDAAEP